MIAMSYNEILEILEIRYKGEISLDNLLELGNKINQNKHLPRNLKILADATKAKYTFNIDKIPLIANDLNKKTKGYESIKFAMIQEKPEETAMSFALQNENYTPHYSHKIFCTKSSAIEWLLSE